MGELRTDYGFLTYGYRPGASVEVENLEVAESHRRKGIGSELMAKLEDMATGDRKVSIYGFTAADNMIAQAFYVYCGYSLTPIPDHYGKGRHAFIFSKALR